MPFKTNPLPASLVPLTGFGLLAVSGPDSAAFLQAQTMNDVRDLRPGHWHWNGWLNPKGRVVALFALLRTDEQAFVVISPDMPADELRVLWQRYVFRSKVALAAAVGWSCAGARRAGDASPVGLADGDPESGWSLCWPDAGDDRSLWLLPSQHPALSAPDAGLENTWRDRDLRRGLPRLAVSARERWTPHMLGLDRLGAFSVRKGCYPGQEIVARTHFLGQARRTLFGLDGRIPERAELVTDATGRAVGEVVAVDSTGSFCLAVLPTDAAVPVLAVAGAPVSVSPLPDGVRPSA